MDPVTAPETAAAARRTEPATVHLRRDNLGPAPGSRAAAAALLGIFWAIFLVSGTSVLAQEKDTVLPESGIHYPGGFDPNTVGEVQGKVAGYAQPGKGPVQFRIDTGRGTYMILASPQWYWNDLGGKIPEGTEVRVKGSKSLGNDGNLYVIAQEIRILGSGKTMVLRAEDGAPLWKGSGMGSIGGRGGFGSSPGGMGGPGGMGRGRR